MNKTDIRNHFTDFRYLGSTKDPNILKEFVRYDEVLTLIEKIVGQKIE